MVHYYQVGLIGFNEVESGKIEKIFHVTQTRDRRYSLKPLNDQAIIDMLIVNRDTNSDSLAALNDFQQAHPESIVVTFSKNREADNEGAHHIKGMLLATKVIKALDAIAVAERQSVSQKIQQPIPVASQQKTSRENQEIATTIPADVLNVLVVDDSAVMQKSLAIELAKASQATQIDFADNGESALQMITNKHYDFIFLDVMMPGIDGYETCTEIRKIPGMKRTPVIMLSAKTSPLDEVKGVMAGCTSYLTKPIQTADFQKMLERVMTWLRDFKQTKTVKET
ncbi:MAG: response regulator [Methylobacter sp.]|nr:response regulator [Methylobacter sp.]